MENVTPIESARPQRSVRVRLMHVEMMRGEEGWTVAATYASESVTFVAEKHHAEYGAAIASLVNDTPDTVELQLAP